MKRESWSILLAVLVVAMIASPVAAFGNVQSAAMDTDPDEDDDDEEGSENEVSSSPLSISLPAVVVYSSLVLVIVAGGWFILTGRKSR